MPNKDIKTLKLRKIRDEVFDFKKSPLYKDRVANKVFPVLGEGNHDARIMFIGEAPGKNEAETGRPFCGAAGKVLDELLDSAKLDREEVYVTNIVKDRPPQNRDPSMEEIELYAPFLDRQIAIIKPKVIATLGRFSMEYVMRRYGLGDKVESISRAHGKVYETTIKGGKCKIVPLYHPAVALYGRGQIAILKKDFKILTKM